MVLGVQKLFQYLVAYLFLQLEALEHWEGLHCGPPVLHCRIGPALAGSHSNLLPAHWRGGVNKQAKWRLAIW